MSPCSTPRAWRSSPPSRLPTSPNSPPTTARAIFRQHRKRGGSDGAHRQPQIAVRRAFPLPGCASPSGLAIDRVHRRLFSVCDGKTMAVTDAGAAASGPGTHRGWPGCRRIRCEARPGIQFQRRRHLDGGPATVGGSIQRAGHGADSARCAHHGAGCGRRQGLHGQRRLRAARRPDAGAAASLGRCPHPTHSLCWSSADLDPGHRRCFIAAFSKIVVPSCPWRNSPTKARPISS